MERGLRLQRSEMTRRNTVGLGVFRVRWDIVDVLNMPAEVFLYRRRPPHPKDPTPVDDFMTVCSAPDLADYPAAEPTLETDLPFFRLNYVEMDFRAVSEADSTTPIIEKALLRLIDALKAADDLSLIGDGWVGDEPESS
jgi:hypothetical protein